VVMLLGALPIFELRGALPVALLVYNIPAPLAVTLSIVGNIVPVYFLLLFFDRSCQYLMKKSPLAARIFNWLFARTRRKLTAPILKYGTLALAFFVAMPLPITGAWTGSLAAFVFGLPKGRAWVSILAGLIVSATIVLILTLGIAATLELVLQ
jgi:uncharacterized membrane protein